MKIIAISDTEFQMEVETQADRDFLDALDINDRRIYLESLKRMRPEGCKHFINQTATFNVARSSEKALADEAGRKCLSALRQLASLALADTAND